VGVVVMAVSADAVANFFLQRGDEITPMKLQKLVYFAHGWHLGLKSNPLINEHFEAWRHGPVIPSLFREFKYFGNSPISRKAKELRYVGESEISLEEIEPSIDSEVQDEAERDFLNAFLDRVWKTYGHFTAIQLSNLTHEKGTPWDRIATRYNEKIPRGLAIPDNLIREYFLNKMKLLGNATSY
jgi:uncharacterized phage-associated protein